MTTTYQPTPQMIQELFHPVSIVFFENEQKQIFVQALIHGNEDVKSGIKFGFAAMFDSESIMQKTFPTLQNIFLSLINESVIGYYPSKFYVKDISGNKYYEAPQNILSVSFDSYVEDGGECGTC